MAQTRDGSLHWEFVAWTAPDPGAGFTIMPPRYGFRKQIWSPRCGTRIRAKGSELD
jgi:hypothetical protein